MNKEELKTVIGSLMSDLRGNWAYDYTERMRLLIELLNELKSLDPELQSDCDNLISHTEGEIEDPYVWRTYGRTFRGAFLYGYASEEGCTREVYTYLERVLTHPEYNNIKVNIATERDEKLNQIL
jgi:hypothetical protein